MKAKLIREWDTMHDMPQSKTRQIALASVLAAVYFVLRAIPTFQMIGVSGRFTAADFILTSVAIIAGTRSSVLAVVAGTILAYPVRSPVFFGFDFVPGLVNVLAASLILSKRFLIVRGAYIIIMVAYLLSPYSLLFGYGYIPFTWLHIIALAVLVSPMAERVPVWIARNDSHRVAAIATLAFVGTMLQHLAGGLLYETTVGLLGGISPSSFKQFWYAIFWLYPVERIVIVALSTITATALLRSLRTWPSVPEQG